MNAPRTLGYPTVRRLRWSTSRHGGRRAIVEVRGAGATEPEALLEVAHRLKRALRLLSVNDITIEVNPPDGTGT